MDPLRLAEAQGVEFALLGHTVGHSCGHSIQFRVFWQCTPQTLTKPIMKIFTQDSNTEFTENTVPRSEHIMRALNQKDLPVFPR